MSDDTPTQRLPETTDASGELVEERMKSKALLFTLVGVGTALLIAIIVLLILLFGGNGTSGPQPSPSDSDTPSASPAPSDSPTPTESATPTPTAAPPPPPPPSPIISYTVSATDAGCSASEISNGDLKTLTFSWDTTGNSVNFGIATDFADTEPYETNLNPDDSISVNYICSNETTKFSIAVFLGGDVIDRETIIVHN